MQARLQRYTVYRWASDFVQATLGTAVIKRSSKRRVFAKARKTLLKEYQRSRKRLILLDYDGTLVPFVPDYASARPGQKVLSLVQRLADDSANRVVIVSGRDRETLGSWFEALPVHMVAEHGFFHERREANGVP